MEPQVMKPPVSDEVFVFASKRKADPFFIDSDDETVVAKKFRIEGGRICEVGAASSTTKDSDDGEMSTVCEHADSKCEVIDITSDNCEQKPLAGPQFPAAANADVIDLTVHGPKIVNIKSVKVCDDYEPGNIINLTHQNGPPEAPQVSSTLPASDDNDDELPDLVAPGPAPNTHRANNTDVYSPASPSVESDGSSPELPQNQLMDRKAAAKYNRVWYG